jgi:putative flippase GtrA
MDVTANERRSRNLLDSLIGWVAGRFGSRAREVERFIKFAIVGVVGSVVDFATLNILQHTVLVPEGAQVSLKVGLATGTAFTMAVLSNYVWNRYWTFPDSRSRSAMRQLVQFFLVSIVGLLFRLVFVSATYRFFGDLGSTILSGEMSATAVNQLGSNIAQAISIGIILFWNFFANRYWTYNDVT